MRHLAPLIAASLIITACGGSDPQSGPAPGNATRGAMSSPIGSACTTVADCGGTGFCSTVASLPGGYCSVDCTDANTCGSSAVCVDTGGAGACFQRCAQVGTRSSCREGYTCLGLEGRSDGVCLTQRFASSIGGPPSGVGGPCTGDASCAEGLTCEQGELPGGLCTRECRSNPGSCGSASACIEFTGGRTACLERCSAPGTRSTCRTGYQCILAGDTGVCWVE